MIKDLVNSIERNSTVGEGTNENEKCASVMVEKHLKYHICEISKKNAILKSDLCESSASGSNFSHSLTFIANDGQGGGSPPLPSPPGLEAMPFSWGRWDSGGRNAKIL